MRRAAVAAAAALTLASAPAQAAFPYNGLPPIPSDPAAMALARKALGPTCRWNKDGGGPLIAGFTTPTNLGWANIPGGAVYVRRRGAQRIAVMVMLGEKDACAILAVQPLPPYEKGEEFKQCHVDSPDPNVNAPISEGFGLLHRGKLAAYLEADFKRKTLSPRDPTDKRLTCSEFETV